MRHLKPYSSTLLLVAATSLAISIGCGEGFVVHKGEPKLVGVLAGSKTYRRVDGADAATFRSLPSDDRAKAIYAIDSRNVFIGMDGSPMQVKGARPETFQILTADGSYGADSERVFWFGLEIPTADPATFEQLTPPYARDKEGVYVGAERLQECNPDEFEVIKVWGYTPPVHPQSGRLVPVKDGAWIVAWSKDDKHYYWAGSALEGADYQTVAILNKYFARDHGHVYFKGRVVTDADPETFSIQGRGGMKGKDRFRTYDLSDR